MNALTDRTKILLSMLSAAWLAHGEPALAADKTVCVNVVVREAPGQPQAAPAPVPPPPPSAAEREGESAGDLSGLLEEQRLARMQRAIAAARTLPQPTA